MASSRQSWLLNFLVSPYGLALISYVLFLSACLMPPSFYVHYMNEPDLMFLDPATILAYSLGVMCFVAGVWVVGWLCPATFTEYEISTRFSPLAFLLAPLILGILLAVIATVNLLRSYPLILLYLVARRGEDIKDTMVLDATGHYGLVPHILIGITWWAYWRYPKLCLSARSKSLAKTVISLAVVVIVALCVVTMNRSVAMIAMSGLAILFLARRVADGRVANKFLLRSSVAILFGIPLLFMLFTFMRGTTDLDTQINALLGYTIASYNRMAAAMNGDLHFSFSGYGLGIGGFVITSRLLPLRAYLDLPDPINLSGSSFMVVTQAGLDGRLVWEGAFADIYQDLGWFFLLFIFGYGLLYGIIWTWFKQGKTPGVVLYPWFGFCILFWIGGNYLFGGPVEALLPITAILTFYELAGVRRANSGSPG